MVQHQHRNQAWNILPKIQALHHHIPIQTLLSNNSPLYNLINKKNHRIEVHVKQQLGKQLWLTSIVVWSILYLQSRGSPFLNSQYLQLGPLENNIEKYNQNYSKASLQKPSVQFTYAHRNETKHGNSNRLTQATRLKLHTSTKIWHSWQENWISKELGYLEIREGYVGNWQKSCN